MEPLQVTITWACGVSLRLSRHDLNGGECPSGFRVPGGSVLCGWMDFIVNA